MNTSIMQNALGVSRQECQDMRYEGNELKFPTLYKVVWNNSFSIIFSNFVVSDYIDYQ